MRESPGVRALKGLDVAADLEATVDEPVEAGDWWRIADSAPDLGEYDAPTRGASDFTIYRAADGTWQLIACVRGAEAGSGRGKDAVLSRWESKDLTAPNWTPCGVVATPGLDGGGGYVVGGPCCVRDGQAWRAVAGGGRG